MMAAQIELDRLINDLVEDRAVDTAELQRLFAGLCDGVSFPPEQLAALLVLMRTRRESAEQLAGIATVLLERAVPVELPDARVCLCGTGGDNSGTFNISTTASLLVAACGVPVAKHGSGAVTSKSGSADVLKELGIATELGPEQAASSLKHGNFTFLSAQVYHPSFRHISPVRRALKVRTIFNIIGPLLHPSGLGRQVIGVFDAGLLERLAGAFARLGHERTLVVCSADGMDEISMSGPSQGKLVEPGGIRDFSIDPRDYGFRLCTLEDLQGGDARENAGIALDIFAGARGPKSDCVVLNSGIAIYLSGRSDTIEDGIGIAREVQESGRALALIERLRELNPAWHFPTS